MAIRAEQDTQLSRTAAVHRMLSTLISSTFQSEFSRQQLYIAFPNLDITEKQAERILTALDGAAQRHLDGHLEPKLAANNFHHISETIDLERPYLITATEDEDTVSVPHSNLPKQTFHEVLADCYTDHMTKLKQILAEKQEKDAQLRQQAKKNVDNFHSLCHRMEAVKSGLPR